MMGRRGIGRVGRPSLVRAAATTAVVAGTATAVSNRVSRRQGRRWAERDQQTYEAQQYEDQQQYAPPPQQYAPPPQQSAPPPAIAPAAGGITQDTINQLKQLGDLKAQGILTEQEFAAQKAKLLGS